ncbi:MAG: prepilin-type N-terminal cleavage/methylation domain-containing protein, partial [Patescibacteria group bacterium]|nr:prepilin-type N-terminal cleavage/methylation domain-containing protein [Patescibacteria group bacterium]
MKRGITLMEVLIAMFVLLIGLLGVFSMLPVAKSYMADGVKYDAVSTIGHKALHEMEVRDDLMDPLNWFAPAGSGQFLWVCPPQGKGSPTVLVNDFTYNYKWASQSVIQDTPAAPFILDPLGCAYATNLAANAGIKPDGTSGPATYANDFGPAFFPPAGYSLDFVGGAFAAPALSRITIPMLGRTGLGAGGAFAQPMAFAQAAKIFQSSDDVLFNRSDDPTQRPFASLPTAAAPTQFSTSQGDYSWFAVIDSWERPWHPGVDSNGNPGSWGAMGVDDNSDGLTDEYSEEGFPNTNDPDVALWRRGGVQEWKVWCVVVHKRNLSLQTTSPTEVPPERMCYCDFLSAPNPPPSAAVVANAGMGVGDCLLSMPASATVPLEWLNVKPNQWIMLSGFENLNSNLSLPPVKSQLCSVAWVRISSVGEPVNSS